MNWQNGFQQPPAPLDQRMQSYDAAAAQTQQTVKDLAYFQSMGNAQVQIALTKAQTDAELAKIDAKARADLALANVNNQAQITLAILKQPQPQVMPASTHSTFAWLKHPLVLMAIAAVLPVLLERLFRYRRSTSASVRRRYNPQSRKVQRFYRKRSRFSRLAYQD